MSVDSQSSLWVYRRVPPNYIKLDQPFPISWEAFRPRENETEGISVWYKHIATLEDVLASVRSRNKDPMTFGVVELEISYLESLDLTVIADSDPEKPGHALIRELNRTAYESNRDYWQCEICANLAEYAGNHFVQKPKPPEPKFGLGR